MRDYVFNRRGGNVSASVSKGQFFIETIVSCTHRTSDDSIERRNSTDKCIFCGHNKPYTARGGNGAANEHRTINPINGDWQGQIVDTANVDNANEKSISIYLHDDDIPHQNLPISLDNQVDRNNDVCLLEHASAPVLPMEITDPSTSNVNRSHPTTNNPTVPPTNGNLKRSSMYYQNVRGLRTKTQDFRLSSTGCDYDVISLTETGLHSGLNDGELVDCNDFCIYRCDRSELNSDHERFGGVLVAVRSKIASERIVVPSTECVEMVVARLRFCKMCVYICCLYIPSGSPVSVYRQYTDALRTVVEFIDMDAVDKLYVAGDFNMRDVCWVREPDDDDFSYLNQLHCASNAFLPSNVGSSANTDLLHSLMSVNLNQINDVKNFLGGEFWIWCFAMMMMPRFLNPSLLLS